MKKPIKAFYDLDVALFQAACAGQKTQYDYIDKDGNVIATFDSADAGKMWIQEMENLGVDTKFGYKGEPEDLTRSDMYLKDLGFKAVPDVFDMIYEEWKEVTGVGNHTGYVSTATGNANFRYDIATLHPYKGKRSGAVKPLYLEQTRKYVQSLPDIKSPRSRHEVDDFVLAYAQNAGEKGVAVAVDKDVRSGVGCWIMHIGSMKEPQFSDPSIVGTISLNAKGEPEGLGYLFLMYQALAGDAVDGYYGIPKLGKKGAVKLLQEFSEEPITRMYDLLNVCIERYKKGFGETYTYNHHSTGEEITATAYQLFRENLALAYMLRGKNDSVEKSVLKYLEK